MSLIGIQFLIKSIDDYICENDYSNSSHLCQSMIECDGKIEMIDIDSDTNKIINVKINKINRSLLPSIGIIQMNKEKILNQKKIKITIDQCYLDKGRIFLKESEHIIDIPNEIISISSSLTSSSPQKSLPPSTSPSSSFFTSTSSTTSHSSMLSIPKIYNIKINFYTWNFKFQDEMKLNQLFFPSFESISNKIKPNNMDKLYSFHESFDLSLSKIENNRNYRKNSLILFFFFLFFYWIVFFIRFISLNKKKKQLAIKIE